MISNHPGVALIPAQPIASGSGSASDFRYQQDPFDAANRIREEREASQDQSSSEAS